MNPINPRPASIEEQVLGSGKLRHGRGLPMQKTHFQEHRNLVFRRKNGNLAYRFQIKFYQASRSQGTILHPVATSPHRWWR
jgi:hypothetical protein